MKYLIAFIAIISIMASCSSTKDMAETITPPGTPTKAVEPPIIAPLAEHQVVFENITKGDSLFASIKRGYCYGTCPVYELNIYNSGFTTYKGIRSVEMMGEYTSHLRNDQMAKFVSLASEIGYMEMKDEYDNPGVTDLPECNTSIVLSGKRKSIKRRFDYPRSILAFEKLFDALQTSQKWVKEVK